MPKILVVADAPWVRNDVHAALSQPGFELTDHDEPSTVVEAVAAGDLDAVLVDLQVGAMGGMAITRAVRHASSRDEISHVPVIMMLDRHADVFLARRAGAHAWLKKPFTANELRQAVDEATKAALAELDA